MTVVVSKRSLLKTHVAQINGAQFDGDTCVSFMVGEHTINLFFCDISDYPNTKGFLSTQDETIASLIEQNQQVTGDFLSIAAACRRLLTQPPHFGTIPSTLSYNIYTRTVIDDDHALITKYFVTRVDALPFTVIVAQDTSNTLYLVDYKYPVSEENITRVIENPYLSAWTIIDFCKPLLISPSVNITKLLDTIRKRVSEILERCMICHKIFPHRTLRPGVCGAELCIFQMITYCLGVSPAMEIIHRGHVVDLLVQLALVQEPLDDFALLSDLPSTKDMFEMVYKNELESNLGNRMSQFFWVLASNKADIELCGDIIVPGYICFKITLDDPEKEKLFQACKHEHAVNDKRLYAFHGSSVSNWHSILRTGLNYDKVTNGRAYGDGIYFSTNMETAAGYARKASIKNSWKNSVFDISACISVNELVNAPDKFVSKSPHLVVNNIDWVQLRYLLVATTTFTPVSRGVGEVESLAEPLFDKHGNTLDVFKGGDNGDTPEYATPTATKSIMRELQSLPEETDWFRYSRERINNIYQWPFTMVLPSTTLTFEITFPPTYPMEPPFVRVVSPRFVPFANGGGGHITAGGSICMELLSGSGWLPSYSLEKVFYQIFIEISLADPPAVVQDPSGSYSRAEAWAGYERAANVHNWTFNSGNRKYFGA